MRYGPSCRDADELLAERGIAVDHVTVCRRVQRLTPEFIGVDRPCRHAPADRWFTDETYLKIAGRWAYLYRAIDQRGQVINVPLSERRGRGPAVLHPGGMGARSRAAALTRLQLQPGEPPPLVVAAGPYAGEGFDCPAHG